MPENAINKLMKRKKVGQILLERQIITQAQLDDALEKQASSNQRQLLGEVIVDLGYCTADEVLAALAHAHDIPYVKLEPGIFDPSVSRLLPRQFMDKHTVLPLYYIDKVLTVALSEPTNLYLIEEINGFIEGTVQAVAASSEDIRYALETHIPDESSYAIDDLVEDPASAIDVVDRKQQEVVNLEEVASESPVIKLVNYMIYTAVRERASDIHIEPDDYTLRVRFRIDGRLVERLKPPFKMHPAIVSRIKIMAALDISERRLPQDGSIHVIMQGKPIDLRVSVLPTTFGEKVVIRIIDNSNILVELDKLGMDAETRDRFQAEISRPHGLILVTGPTGSGKSTTLYSVLSELCAPEINICTAEDPIEFNLKGVNQFQVHAKIGMTFPNILRALLRQDPDVIMVGEMRDNETAAIGVQASLTGHMVLSTLHTNDAPGAITRLFNLGIEPYLVGASLTAIVAQRLVRRICPNCLVEFEPSATVLEQLESLGVRPIERFHRGRGCTRCNATGYQGRIGLFELLIPDDDMRDMVTAGATLDALRTKATSLGMCTLFDDGITKVIEGQTTVDEVLRVTVQS